MPRNHAHVLDRTGFGDCRLRDHGSLNSRHFPQKWLGSLPEVYLPPCGLGYRRHLCLKSRAPEDYYPVIGLHVNWPPREF
jgi:hypothetical protein